VQILDRLSEMLAAQKRAHALQPYPSRRERIDRLDRLRSLLALYGARLTAAVEQDFGTRSPIVTAIADTMFVQRAIAHARRHLGEWMAARPVATGILFAPSRGEVVCQPLGTVGIIGAWNYPIQLVLSPLVDVIAAGNRAILKPSELTPRYAELLESAIGDAFSPEEVAVVTGGAEVGQALASLPLDHLVFTGSGRVGRLIAAAAAPNLTPVTLELGGKSPAIVHPSAHLPRAADRVAWGKLLNAGQTCIAPDYALVHEDYVEAFATAVSESIARQYPTIAGNPDYTSIITGRHYNRLRSLVDDARAHGARVVEVNPGSGVVDHASRKIAPTLLLGVTGEMTVMQEEIFGPLLPIVPYASHDEAIAFVNERDRPLALYWFGTSSKHRRHILERTVSGAVTINGTLVHIAQENLPFGGVGPSGQGHYHGEAGFRRFSKEKSVFFESRFSAMRLLYPPYRGAAERRLRWLDRWPFNR
jgi:coniferyl-aldehyde dehydrogenase